VVSMTSLSLSILLIAVICPYIAPAIAWASPS